jgi:hypothetical protein
MKPARSILPAVDQAMEEANGQRVAMVGRTPFLAQLLQQAVTPRLAPQPAVLAWGRALLDPTTNPAGPAAATWCASAAPRCQRPH